MGGHSTVEKLFGIVIRLQNMKMRKMFITDRKQDD